ncbi:MAG: hypothetical protein IKC55_00460, partial [Clostridia bacterium]|nr:hypothetical protein [Clostridia bacterium]
PLFVINLITDYKYQFDLQFQYSFGSGALLVYAAAINLADLSDAPFALSAPESEDATDSRSALKRFAAGASASLVVLALVSSLFLGAARAPSQFFYVERCKEEKETFTVAKEVLDSIDRDKSVMATSMYLTPLYDVDELYHSSQATAEKISSVTGKFIGYDIIIETDVVVIDLRPYMSDASKAPYWKSSYLAAGYEVVVEHEDIILVLEKK